MTPEEIKNILSQGFDNAEIMVEGDGSHFQVTVISNQFDGLRPVKRQQMVYSLVNELITSGTLHAIGIKAYTEEEWQKAQKFLVN
jgi:acid stress-induced BolA-like protein IbaG/YrbA